MVAPSPSFSSSVYPTKRADPKPNQGLLVHLKVELIPLAMYYLLRLSRTTTQVHWFGYPKIWAAKLSSYVCMICPMAADNRRKYYIRSEGLDSSKGRGGVPVFSRGVRCRLFCFVFVGGLCRPLYELFSTMVEPLPLAAGGGRYLPSPSWAV